MLDQERDWTVRSDNKTFDITVCTYFEWLVVSWNLKIMEMGYVPDDPYAGYVDDDSELEYSDEER